MSFCSEMSSRNSRWGQGSLDLCSIWTFVLPWKNSFDYRNSRVPRCTGDACHPRIVIFVAFILWHVFNRSPSFQTFSVRSFCHQSWYSCTVCLFVSVAKISKNRADFEKRSNSSNSMFKKCIFEAVYKGLRFLMVQRCCKLYMYRCIIYFFQPSPLQSMQSVFSYLKVGTAAWRRHPDANVAHAAGAGAKSGIDWMKNHRNFCE